MNATMTSTAVPLNWMARAITLYGLKYAKNTIDDRRDGIVPYIDSEHATPHVGMPRSINHAKRNDEPNQLAARGQTTSRIGCPCVAKPRAESAGHGKPEWQAGMASRNGKPEWQARRRPRQAGMASRTTAMASRNGKPDDGHG